MRKLSIFGLPLLFALSAVLSGPLFAPKAAAYDDDDYYRDRYRDLDDDDDALGSEAAYGYFREELLPYGEWVQVPTYRWTWRPYNVGADWQPYTLGRWINTNYGWAWVSAEPWGRSPYHYGRWYWDRRYSGWLWVPGRRWAPAWVDWREGNRYWGWAPLPPTAAWQPGVGIPTRTIIIEPRHYCFVEKRYFVEPNIRRYIAPAAQNVTIIQNTTNVTNYTIVNRRVANHSIHEASVEKAIGHQVPRYPVAEVESAAPRAFHKEDRRGGRGAPARSVEQNEPQRDFEAQHARPPAAAQSHGRVHADRSGADVADRADHDRRLQAERDRQDAESRERARLDQERQDRDRKTAERTQDAERQRHATREREAVRQADVQRKAAAEQRHDLEVRERRVREQETRRREVTERSREAAHQPAVQQQEAARGRVERGKAQQEAARQQAEAERRRAPHPQPQAQAQSQPKRQHQPDPRDGH